MAAEVTGPMAEPTMVTKQKQYQTAFYALCLYAWTSTALGLYWKLLLTAADNYRRDSLVVKVLRESDCWMFSLQWDIYIALLQGLGHLGRGLAGRNVKQGVL